MKYIFFALTVALLVSCVSTKYDIAKSNYNFGEIRAGSKYTVFDKGKHKIFLNVTSVEKDSIIGVRKKERFAIAKNDIKKINKNKTGATIALIGGFAAVIGTTWMITETVGEVALAVVGGAN